MSSNPDKRINYCFVGSDGMPHVVVVIRWEKGNLYFMDIGQPWKKSYHSPRNGKSQVHLKVNGFIPMEPDFSAPIEEIENVRPLGGSGMVLDELVKLPVAKEGNGENYILDTRPFHRSRLSKVQWDHFLVQPDSEVAINQTLREREERNKDKVSEQIAIHKLTESKPWIVTEFRRICNENPMWYS